MPKLPRPKPDPSSKKRISYSKDLEEVQIVQDYLLKKIQSHPLKWERSVLIRC